MATGVSSILNIGRGALFASQTALQTVGNNVANVNTDGYSRQAVRLEAWPSLDFNPGQMGQGVNAVEVMHYFDKFVERSYLQNNGDYNRWAAMQSNMTNVEAIFNESGGYGIGSLMNSFFSSWEDLTQFPDDMAARQTLVSNSLTLTESIKSAQSSLQKAEERADSMITEQVNRANELITNIAALNKQIALHYVRNKNNPNSLLDERDSLVRELSGLIDVDVLDRGGGEYIVNMKGGQTLVDGSASFSLSYDGPKAFQTKNTLTTFQGNIEFDGSDGYEYTIEFVTAGQLNNNPNADPSDIPPPPLFRVSLDGGRTWATDADGNEMHFLANDSDIPVQVKDLQISFNATGDDNFVVGDRFTIVPKSALYYIKPTIGPLLVTPQQFQDESVSQHRANGGSIAGNLLFKDYQAGQIRDQLDEFSKNFIWEVNRIHSQGAGLSMFSSTIGDYRVRDTSYPLNSMHNDLPWAERLEAGSFSIALYHPDTGAPIILDGGVTNALDISFDPGQSLDDLVTSLNNAQIDIGDGLTHTLSEFLQIGTTDNRLSIQPKAFSDGKYYSFGFGDDTTGVLAALGINNFFKGDSAATIGICDTVSQDLNMVNAGRINGGGEANKGDNITAREIGGLAERKLSFIDWTGQSYEQSIVHYYSMLVSNVGSKAAAANFNTSSTQAITLQLEDRQSEVSGVNLDEEMSNLIRFQSSYKAAAKLITTADEMLQTLLSLKQ